MLFSENERAGDPENIAFKNPNLIKVKLCLTTKLL